MTANEHVINNIRTKPALRALIRESECIGCMKCVHACPVDTIIGAPKLMHTVIADVCIGCELCVPPCPVDCIDMIALPKRTEEEKNKLIDKARVRFEKRNQRLANIDQHTEQPAFTAKTVDARKAAIREAMRRIHKARTSEQF